MFDLTACHVERTPEQDYLIRWRCSEPGLKVRVYMAEDANTYYNQQDPGQPLLETTDSQALIRNPDKHLRHYFYLESEHGEGVVLAERQLALEGTPNFRDLGGYTTADGRKLKWGKLYRSSKLSALTNYDQQRVHRLGLTLICDFRQVVEQELEPSLLAPNSQHLLASLPIAPGSSNSFIENLHNGIIAVDDASGFMQEMNRDFVINQLPQYAEMFRLLLADDHQVLIHCASGKDRTGFGTALILDVLGVDEEQIIHDYLLTNRYLPIDKEMEKLAGQFKDASGKAVAADVLRPLLEVRPEYLIACFDEIRKRYASKEHFFATELKLDDKLIEQLRERYLHH